MPELQELFDLTDRVAIVTGGAGLLGAEFCRTLAAAGAHVVIADVDEEMTLRVLETLSVIGLGVKTDIASLESVKRLVETTLKTFGRLDILVNSAVIDPKFDPSHAGEQKGFDFETYPLDLWNQALAVNLTGMFLCCQASVKAMLVQGQGVMINICSIYGVVGPDQRIYQGEGQPAQYKPVYYSVTKAGVLGLTNYLATYYAGKNIRVNALTPGGVYNEHAEAFVKEYAARTVLGRMANKSEMNGALLFLASDASSYMTGANLIVDGGWTAW